MIAPNTLLFENEPWRIGMNETVYRKAFKTQQFYFTHKKNLSHKKKLELSRSLASDNSNYLNQTYFHIFCIPALPAGY